MSEQTKNEDFTEITIGSKIHYKKLDEIVEQFREAKSAWVQLAVLVSKVMTAWVWSQAVVQILTQWT